jgi:ATP-dependent RNA helicase MSS116
MTSQVMYGGTSKLSDIQKFNDTHPYILVATPGRLIDHIQSSRIGGASSPNTPFMDVIKDTSIWVLDEADRCLDMGFQKSMEYILSHKKTNDTTVQTLLFSATLPPDLRSIMASHMKRNYLTVDCVKDVTTTAAATTTATIASAETTSTNEDDKAFVVAKGWYEKKEML